MDIDKELQFSILLDYYSEMLTDKQKDAMDLYYNEDLSLSEIAEHQSITRQGVRDSIKRGEQILLNMEEKFHLVEKTKQYRDVIKEVGELSAAICDECAYCGNPKGILKRAEYLVKLADFNKELL